MKKITFLLCALALSAALLPACKKSNTGGGNSTAGNGSGNGNGNNFSDSIRNIVPQPIIDSLRNWGMTIYDGQKPPTLSGSYLIVTDSCIFDNSGYMTAGRLFDEYQYTFSKEDLSRLTIRIDTKAINDPNGYTENDTDSTATFLAGTGNNFTIFAEEKGIVTSGYGISTYTELNIISGQITSSGIAHFEYSIYMKDKNDPANQLIPVNSSRIFLDGDPQGLARQTTTWSPLPFTVIGTKNSVIQ